MKSRLMIPALLGVAMLSTPVLAGGMQSTGMSPNHPTQTAAMTDDAGMCSSLERHFDRIAMPHEKGGWNNYAKDLRAQGGKLCANGDYSHGVAKLQSALSDLTGGPAKSFVG